MYIIIVHYYALSRINLYALSNRFEISRCHLGCDQREGTIN